MNAKVNVQGYLDSINAPWGQLFYRLVWHNIECKDKKILDFGSGFGVTADHLAENNDVTAVEPNGEMLQYRFCAHEYRQFQGSIEQLRQMPNQSYDMIICHNVLEYAENRTELFGEFHRILKPDGIVSLVKHNKAGKVMQKAVFEYQIEDALELLHHGEAVSANFGTINEYDFGELRKYADGFFEMEKTYGIRMFFGLQRNEFKTESDWLDKMFCLECAAEEIPAFRDVAFFHHVILRKLM